eukprot:12638032-Alexandrium_andersonii.AAC.1
MATQAAGSRKSPGKGPASGARGSSPLRSARATRSYISRICSGPGVRSGGRAVTGAGRDRAAERP